MYRNEVLGEKRRGVGFVTNQPRDLRQILSSLHLFMKWEKLAHEITKLCLTLMSYRCNAGAATERVCHCPL